MARNNESLIWLSHSGIEIMYRCPRCFWLKYNRKISQPEGIQSRLANRFDILIKKYFDIFREAGELPPMIEGKVEGKLENPFEEKYFYRHDGKYGLWGKLDECLVSGGRYTPVDHKTASSDPRTKETLEAYGHQLDSYAFLLEKNGKPTSGVGHLIYYFPEESDELNKGVHLYTQVTTLKTNPAAAERELEAAIKILEKDMPEAAADCPFCGWHEKLKTLGI